MESATPLASKFGVEIETRIQGLGDEDSPDMSKEQDNSEPTEEQKQMKRWERHVDPLSAELAKMNVGNHLMADQYEKEKETYEEWYLTQDDSINTQDGSCSYNMFPLHPVGNVMQLAEPLVSLTNIRTYHDRGRRTSLAGL